MARPILASRIRTGSHAPETMARTRLASRARLASRGLLASRALRRTLRPEITASTLPASRIRS